MTEEEKDKKEFKEIDKFSPSKLKDLISPAREKVLKNFSNRCPSDMLDYLAVQTGMIKRHLPKVYKEIMEKLESENTLYTDELRMDIKDWFEWWQLLEKPGSMLDLHLFVKDRPDFTDMLGQSSLKPVYIYGDLFNLIDDLFSPGKDNLMYGGKKTGKSALAFNLMEQSVNQGYKVATSVKVKKDKRNDPFIQDNFDVCFFMSELLKSISDNMIRVYTYRAKNLHYKISNLEVILDEGENFMKSKRSGSSEALDFDMFNQLSRKLFCSVTWIFHKKESCPPDFRESPNLNSLISKGIDENGEPLPKPQKQAVIKFIQDDRVVCMDHIPDNYYFDTEAISSFAINDENYPEKSINMKNIIQLTKGKDGVEVPKAILKFLDSVRLENKSYEEILEMCRRIEKEIKPLINNCSNQTQYYTLARKTLEEKYSINDISIIKLAEKGLKKIVYDSYHLHQVEMKRSLDEPEGLTDHVNCEFDEVYRFCQKYKTDIITGIVGKDYREFNPEEVKNLLSLGIPNNKIIVIYGFKAKDFIYYKMRGKKKQH